MTTRPDRRTAPRRPTVQQGFTLIEVMLALAILFAGLVVLISRTGANIRIAMEAHALDVATELARGKMNDIEEELLDKGFQELDQEFEGDFDEEGWPGYHFKADVIKIELPALGALQAIDGDNASGGEGAAAGDQEGGLATSPLAGMLGGMGMPGGEAGAQANASFIGSQFELISQILEASIRKVTLTLTWKANGDDHDLTVVCYFTEPAAISRVIAGGTGYVDDSENSDSNSDDNSNSNSNNNNRSNGLNRGLSGRRGK